MKGRYFKDREMDRDPRPAPKVKTWKRGEAETIKKGPMIQHPKSNGMHGRKLDEKARERKAENSAEMVASGHKGAHKVVHVHHHIHRHGDKK